MQVALTLNDAEVFDLSRMPNIPALLDKAYKKSRSSIINEIAHDRALFLAFDSWYLTMTPEQRENTMKSIKSTIAIDEIVPKGIRNRELIIEAVERFRAGSASAEIAEPNAE